MSFRFNFAVDVTNDAAVTVILKTNFGDDAKTALAMEALAYNYTNFAISQGIKNLIEEGRNQDLDLKIARVIDKNLSFLQPILERNLHKPITNWVEELKQVQAIYTALAPKLR